MTTLDPEGLEKAARTWAESGPTTAKFDQMADNRREYLLERMAESISAYLDHAHPTITTVEELDALPGRLTVMDDDGEVWQRAFRWSGAQWYMTGAPGVFHTGGIPLPATVIHWGDR